jgi:hypothetical protein
MLSGRCTARARGVTPPAADWDALRQSPAFWDVDPATLDPTRHAAWIIARVLQFGRWDDWVALFRRYSADQIQAALSRRRVPAHLRRFWAAFGAAGQPLHPAVLPPATAALVDRAGAALGPAGAMLGGGTAVALLYGHRVIDTLELATPAPVDPASLAAGLRAAGLDPVVVEARPSLVRFRLAGIAVSYQSMPGIRLDPGPALAGVPVASWPTAAALTCHAIAHRGTRRDCVDLFAFLHAGVSLAQVLDAARDHAPHLDRAAVIRGLLACRAAAASPAYRLRKPWSWALVQDTLLQHVQWFLRDHLPRGAPRTSPT